MINNVMYYNPITNGIIIDTKKLIQASSGISEAICVLNPARLRNYDVRIYIPFYKNSAKIFHGTFTRNKNSVEQTIFPQGFEFH
jgi:hypothetical protein